MGNTSPWSRFSLPCMLAMANVLNVELFEQDSQTPPVTGIDKRAIPHPRPPGPHHPPSPSLPFSLAFLSCLCPLPSALASTALLDKAFHFSRSEHGPSDAQQRAP
eukprot:6907480-Karenia_brevis.AAC.1